MWHPIFQGRTWRRNPEGGTPTLSSPTFPGTLTMLFQAFSWSRSTGVQIAGCAILLFFQPALHAADPAVAFDFGRTAECVEIADASEIDLFDDQKLVELRLRISVHLLSGNIEQLDEVRVEIGARENRMRVHGFSPNTTLESHHTQSIRHTRTTEKGHKLEATLGGELPVPLGDAVASVTPSVSGGVHKNEVVTNTEYRVAPEHTVVASGTIGQEHGVFFKMRASPLSSLEGVHELAVQFVVPQNWRADSVRVCCQATGQDKVLWMEQETTWARVCAPVAIYLAGDIQARQAAEKFAKKRRL